jgi:hypothetical protein
MYSGHNRKENMTLIGGDQEEYFSCLSRVDAASNL